MRQHFQDMTSGTAMPVRRIDYQDEDEKDIDAYHEIIGFITTETSDGRSLLMAINKKFGKTESGAKLCGYTPGLSPAR